MPETFGSSNQKMRCHKPTDRKLNIYGGENLIFSLCTETDHREGKLQPDRNTQYLQCCIVLEVCDMECKPILALTRFLVKFNIQYIIQSTEHS